MKYRPSKTIAVGEIVSYEGKLFRALKPSIGIYPRDDKFYWVKIEEEDLDKPISIPKDTTPDSPIVLPIDTTPDTPIVLPKDDTPETPITFPVDDVPDAPIVLPEFSKLLPIDRYVIVKGKDGEDGRDGGSYIGKPGRDGLDGRDGRDGLNGVDGKDGIGLQFDWNGTKLGVKREDEALFKYVELALKGTETTQSSGGASQKFHLNSVTTGTSLIKAVNLRAATLKSLIAGTNISFTDDGDNITIDSSGGSAGHVIQDEGTPLTARANLNFVGATVAATDDAGNDATVVTITAQPLDATLTSLAAYNTNGLLTQTAADTFTGRSLTAPAAGLTISNNNGVSGNPTFALANDLAALEGLGSTGIAVRSAADTWVQRTITGTTNRLDVTNGNGVSGNPTLDISATYAGQTSITTLGTITTGTWNGTDIALSNIAQVATDSLLGRDTAGTGDIEVLTIGGGLEFTGSGGIQTSAFTGDATKAAGGTVLTLANSGVSAGSYGSGIQVPQITVDAKGRITSATNQLISFPSTPTLQQVTTAGATSNVALTLSGNNIQSGGYLNFNTNIPARFGTLGLSSILYDTGLVIVPDTTSNLVTIGSATGTGSGDLNINKLSLGGTGISADALVNAVISGGSRQVLNFGLQYTSSANGAGIIVSDFDDEGTNVTMTHINADLSSQLRTGAHTTTLNHYGTRTQLGIVGGALGVITAGTLSFYGHRVLMSGNGNANGATSGGVFRRYAIYIDPIGNIAGAPASDLQMGIYSAESINLTVDTPIYYNSTNTALGNSYHVYNNASTDVDIFVDGTKVQTWDNDATDIFVPTNIQSSLQCDSIVNDTGLAAGTYTPTLTGVANVAASTAYQCQYMRVGNTVTVSGKVDVDPTAAASTQLGISLPVASNIGVAEDCAGTAFCPTIAGQGAAILGDAANNRAQLEWIAVDVTNQPMYFTFTYRVI